MQTVRLDPLDAAAEAEAVFAFGPEDVVAHAQLVLRISNRTDLAWANRGDARSRRKSAIHDRLSARRGQIA